MFQDVLQPVLVEDFFAQRVDHPLRLLMFQRPAIPSPPNQSMLMSWPKPPRWELYGDGWTLAYPVIEAYSLNSFQVGSNVTPTLLYYTKSNRVLEDEWQYPKTDHALIHQFRWTQLGILEPFHVDVPELCDNPWLEWVHPPIDHALALYPFRSPSVLGQPYHPELVFWKPRFWDIEAEPDRLRPFDYSALLMLSGHRTPFVPAVPVIFVMDSMWRADESVGDVTRTISADTINYSADGADLINGGGVTTANGPPPYDTTSLPQPTYTVILKF